MPPTQVQNTPTPTFTLTSPSIPTKVTTPTTESPHVLETPIGIVYKLVIHRVQPGESLESIASHYWTTVDAIAAINYHIPSPLLVNWLLIVPINQTDVQGLPVFEAYTVKTSVLVETLTQQLSIDPTMFKLYNGLNDGEILSAGEWVLVPHMATATP
ncbi:MAG: LysM domain-containing protein [Anaerolineales bacterium]